MAKNKNDVPPSEEYFDTVSCETLTDETYCLRTKSGQEIILDKTCRKTFLDIYINGTGSSVFFGEYQKNDDKACIINLFARYLKTDGTFGEGNEEHCNMFCTQAFKEKKICSGDFVRFNAGVYLYRRKDGSYDFSLKNICNLEKTDHIPYYCGNSCEQVSGDRVPFIKAVDTETAVKDFLRENKNKGGLNLNEVNEFYLVEGKREFPLSDIGKIRKGCAFDNIVAKKLYKTFDETKNALAKHTSSITQNGEYFVVKEYAIVASGRDEWGEFSRAFDVSDFTVETIYKALNWKEWNVDGKSFVRIGEEFLEGGKICMRLAEKNEVIHEFSESMIGKIYRMEPVSIEKVVKKELSKKLPKAKPAPEKGYRIVRKRTSFTKRQLRQFLSGTSTKNTWEVSIVSNYDTKEEAEKEFLKINSSLGKEEENMYETCTYTLASNDGNDTMNSSFDVSSFADVFNYDKVDIDGISYYIIHRYDQKSKNKSTIHAVPCDSKVNSCKTDALRAVVNSDYKTKGITTCEKKEKMTINILAS